MKDKESLEILTNDFETETKEILIIVNDNDNIALADDDDTYMISRPCLAFIDLASNKLYERACFLNWLNVNNKTNKFDFNYPYNFKKGVSYKIKVREHIDNQSIKDNKNYPLKFGVVEIIEENIYNSDLEHVLEKYRTLITINDENLGTLILNKDYQCFESDNILWGNIEISVALDVQNDTPTTWEQALFHLKQLVDHQAKFDLDFKTFASNELTDLANDWNEEPDIKISHTDFINRISLSLLNISFEGDLTLFFDDGDLFYGHTIMICGNLKTGLVSATIAG